MRTILICLLGFAVSLLSANAQIQKNTNIQISILGVPPGDAARINASYPVDASGNIRMWEIGSIRAAGLSITALSKKIEQAYKSKEIYTTPTILIQTGDVSGQLQQIITVMGSVQRPGTVGFLKNMTLAQAIAAAGGPNTFGTTKRVTVWREGQKYALSPLTNERHKLERIYPDDVIEVDQVKPWESGGR